jgi:hypothetical protein
MSRSDKKEEKFFSPFLFFMLHLLYGGVYCSGRCKNRQNLEVKMRFRRLVTIMLTLSVVASLMALPVAAIDYSDVVAPLYIGLEDVTADLAISSNGYADCSGAV